ncbi:MAG TPA: hypothetical protein VF898_13305 [Chloroflexota bacterium]
MKKRLVILGLVAALLAGVLSPTFSSTVSAAPQQSHAAAVSTHSHSQAFDKTRFVLHLAVAAFLIHYIYKKYKEGKLGRFHIFTDIKAALAALLAYHEIKVAYDIAKSSSSKTLQLLVSPIGKVTAAINTVATKVKHGDTSAIPTANTLENSLQTTASTTAFAFKDKAPAGFAGF